MMLSTRRRALRVWLSLLLAVATPLVWAQSVPLIGGTAAVQTFDSLAQSGTSNVLPQGWYLLETGSNSDGQYAADDGSANSGNVYSYGSTGSADRALGTLLSGNLKPTIGVQLRNESGNTVSEIAVAYTGEQWRLGAAGRTDRLKAQYSLNASSLADGVWVDAPTLDFVSPNTTTVGKLDGNLPANRTAVSGSISGLSLAVNDTLWLRWVDLDVAGSDDGLAIDDISFTVAGDPPVDVPPSVASTNPAHNAVDVGLDATLSVSFSEPVSLASTWFTLDCSLSGSHSASLSGGPVSYTLTPSASFAPNESCDWTILASGVADMDGTPDAMAADHLVHFSTLDPANLPPPAVSALQPADGAINVPVASDVQVTFSEAVTTSSGAFALSCNATPLVLTETGSGSTRTLTPTTLLPAGANCNFSISASAVQNGFGVPMAANFNSSFSVSDGNVSGYYSQVNTSNPGQLRCSLHATIRGHTAYPYSGSGTSTWTILELAQASANDPNKIIDVYRNRLYQRGSDRAGTGSGITYNREHTWPNSLGFPGATGNLGLPSAPYTDTHMLWLSDTQWNADRGNKPFAYCSSNCGERITEANEGVGGGSGTYPGNSNWVRSPDGNAGSFEVWNHRKGEMARAIMYMAIRYEGGVDPTSGQNEPQLELTDDRAKIVIMNNYSQTAYMGLLTDLLAWHQLDPPDAQEVARNDLIFSFQGNRNPFVDHPEWGTRALFESVTPSQCILNEVDTDIIFVHGFELPATLH